MSLFITPRPHNYWTTIGVCQKVKANKSKRSKYRGGRGQPLLLRDDILRDKRKKWNRQICREKIKTDIF